MSTSVSLSFKRQYESEVHMEYQRIGSKLRNTVRTKNNIKGESTTFQKIGTGVATTKTRHGNVPTMNLDHTPITCTLSDHYAADDVDKLDELKLQHDERRAIVQSGAFALGRQTDQLLIDAAATTTTTVAAGGAGFTKTKALSALETLGDNDVPDDGNRFAFVGWKQWTELLDIPEFKNADYVGDDKLPWKGVQAKIWLGTLWMPHSGLTKVGNDRQCLWYHKSALGHAIGEDITSDIWWNGEKQMHRITNRMSMGACLIDSNGVVRIDCQE